MFAFEDNPFWEYWYFHLPNYALGLLMWTCFGRFALSLFVRPDSQNYIWRFFRLLTDWLIRAVRVITPRFVMDAFLPLVAAFWVIVARFIFLRVMILTGAVTVEGLMGG